MRDLINLVATALGESLDVYPRAAPGDTPASRFCDAVRSKLDALPDLAKVLDLTLTIVDEDTVEITFVEITRLRRRGFGSRVLDLLATLADHVGVRLTLKARSAKGTGGRNMLDQSDLEGFYRRRGFEVTDDADRLMTREPGAAIRPRRIRAVDGS